MLYLIVLFVGLSLARGIFASAVRNYLRSRHPQTWRQLIPSNWQERNSVSGFAWRRGDRELNDPDLTLRIRMLNVVTLAMWAAGWLGVALLLVVLVASIARFV